MAVTRSEELKAPAQVPSRTVPAVSVVWPESAVSASTYSVPSEFLVVADVLVLILAFAYTWILAPQIQWLLAAEQLGSLPWLSWLSPPPSAWARSGSRSLVDSLWIPAVMVPGTLVALQMLGAYRPLLEQSRTRVILSTVAAPLAGLSLVALVVTATRNQSTSRALLFAFALTAVGGLFVTRAILRLYKERRFLAGHYANNLVVIGPPRARSWLVRHFSSTVSPNLYRLVGYLETPPAGNADASLRDCANPDDQPDSSTLLPFLGRVEDLGDLLVHRPIHEVIAVQSEGSDAWLDRVIDHCDYFKIVLRVVPNSLLGRRPEDLPIRFRGDSLRLPEIVLRPRYFNSTALFTKRLLDIGVSALLLVLLSPLFLMIAVAIKLTTPRLPVFYPWRVIGFKGRPFTGYKFTTMQKDADDLKAGLMHLNEMTGPVFKIKDDPRVTPLGRVLRKFSLNELPQLWSVLKGDMSLVGPRPAGPHELERYELWQKRKLSVQPGVTCLWQVCGRNQISDFDDWVRMDFEYIDNWSLWLDIKIMARTVLAVIAGTGS